MDFSILAHNPLLPVATNKEPSISNISIRLLLGGPHLEPCCSTILCCLCVFCIDVSEHAVELYLTIVILEQHAFQPIKKVINSSMLEFGIANQRS